MSMSARPYTLESDQKAVQVVLGTVDAVIWGDLHLKAHLNLGSYLKMLAEEFVPVYDVQIQFLTSKEQTPPVGRPLLYVRLDEVLFLFSPTDSDAPPAETEMRRYEPVEVVIGSFMVEAMLLKSPLAAMLNLLLVTKAPYMDFYGATIRHMTKPWLGTFSTNYVQIRRDRLFLAPR
jgi:hypothetical protein